MIAVTGNRLFEKRPREAWTSTGIRWRIEDEARNKDSKIKFTPHTLAFQTRFSFKNSIAESFLMFFMMALFLANYSVTIILSDSWLSICKWSSFNILWCFTAYWITPWESICSNMCTVVLADKLSSFIKTMQLILEIFKMTIYFPDMQVRWKCRGFWDACPHPINYFPSENDVNYS